MCILSTCWDKMGTRGNDEDATRFIRACHSSLKSLGLRGSCFYPPDSVLGEHGPVSSGSIARKRLKGGARDKLAGRRRCSTSVRGIVSLRAALFLLLCRVSSRGSGSVAEAIRAGIPQIILPTVFDQQHWAERMQWLSVAKILSRTEQVNRLTSTKTSSSWRLNF